MLILSYLLFQARVGACLNHGEGITYNERLQDSVGLHTHQLACQQNSFRLKNYSDRKSHTKHGGFLDGTTKTEIEALPQETCWVPGNRESTLRRLQSSSANIICNK